MYGDECTFVFHNDKRKPYPKEYIDALHTRISILEGLLRNANIEFDSEPCIPVVPKLPTEVSPAPNEIENAATEEYIDRLTDRVGQLSMTPIGLRYFGPTSNLHLLSSIVWTRKPTLNLEYKGRAAIEAAGFTYDIDPVKRDHLLELYWTWHHPFFNLTEKSLFLRDMDLYYKGMVDQAKYFSPLLLNAFLSVATLLDNVYTEGDQYHLKARILLDIEMEQPRITTVQAAAILAACEAVCDRDTRGWIYAGMSIRMAVDMGFQLNCDDWVKKNVITAEEAHMRKITFWGCFVFDRLWSFYMGRPASLRLGDVPLSRPCEADAMLGDKESWVPYTSPTEKLAPMWTEYTAPTHLNATRMYLVKLTEMIAEIQETMYSGSEGLGPELWSFASKMHVRLASWHTKLPSPLLCSPNSQRPVISHIVVLHIQYHGTLILLHRPFLKMVNQDSSVSHAKEICRTSAITISNLLGKYQKSWYSMRYINVIPVHIIFTAATVHLMNAWNDTGINKANATRGLKLCCEALNEMGQSYITAKRTLAVITCLAFQGGNEEIIEAMGLKGNSLETPGFITSVPQYVETGWKPEDQQQDQVGTYKVMETGFPVIHNHDFDLSMEPHQVSGSVSTLKGMPFNTNNFAPITSVMPTTHNISNMSTTNSEWFSKNPAYEPNEGESINNAVTNSASTPYSGTFHPTQDTSPQQQESQSQQLHSPDQQQLLLNHHTSELAKSSMAARKAITDLLILTKPGQFTAAAATSVPVPVTCGSSSASTQGMGLGNLFDGLTGTPGGEMAALDGAELSNLEPWNEFSTVVKRESQPDQNIFYH